MSGQPLPPFPCPQLPLPISAAEKPRIALRRFTRSLSKATASSSVQGAGGAKSPRIGRRPGRKKAQKKEHDLHRPREGNGTPLPKRSDKPCSFSAFACANLPRPILAQRRWARLAKLRRPPCGSSRPPFQGVWVFAARKPASCAGKSCPRPLSCYWIYPPAAFID